jgi:sigma-B regulation protein RsbU (phosphoserine phosphatase)
MGTLVKRRLDLVLGAAEQVGGASTESQIARTIVDAVLSAGGSTRAALVRVNGENLEVLASGGTGDGFFQLSRSLIEEASRGEIVLLESDQPSAGFGQSIIQLGIHSAFCAPVRVGNRVEAVLYLDARGGEAKALEDSVAFVGALARICGLALANLSRASLERHRTQLEADLSAARVAQRIMMPPAAGAIGPVRFSVISKPGRFVAGDLIGIEPRTDGRVCVYIGDVTGKGAGAAMLMGISQSYLSAALASGAAIEDAVNGLNRMIAPRIEPGQFISLWIGEFDAATSVLRSVDAGHGYAMLRSADGTVRTEFGDGSFPVGIEAEERYPVGQTLVRPGDCLLLFSDGLVEQPNSNGEQYGTGRIRACLEAKADPGELLALLEGRLTEFGGSHHFDDDLTVAAFRFSDEG